MVLLSATSLSKVLPEARKFPHMKRKQRGRAGHPLDRSTTRQPHRCSLLQTTKAQLGSNAHVILQSERSAWMASVPLMGRSLTTLSRARRDE